MRFWLAKYINIWVTLGALGVMLILFIVWGFLLWSFSIPSTKPTAPTAMFLVIPAPTQTPTVVQVEQVEQPTSVSNPISIDGISSGTYVQIINTGSVGLRLRSGAGIDQQVQFLAAEGEVYRVEDGPLEIDGYVWWYLVAPYDQRRSGWAVSNYFQAVTADSE